MSQYFEHSSKASQAIRQSVDLWAAIKERFENCPVDRSFSVEAADHFNDSQIRSLVSRRAKTAGKSFSVIKHVNDGGTVYEIARYEKAIPPKAHDTAWKPQATPVGEV